MNDHNILSVKQAVDLGVTVDREMKLWLHIANICRKAHKRANLIIRFFFHSKNIRSLVASYKVYVRPILEYFSLSWNPYLIKDIKALDSVLRRFTKRLPGMGITNTSSTSHSILDSLELRRVRADLIFTYKLVFGLIDASLHDFFVPRFNEFRRGRDYKLYLPTCKSNIRSNSFNY